MTTLAVLIPLLPLLGAIVAGVFGPRRLRGQAHWPVVGGVGGAAVLAVVLLLAISPDTQPHRMIYEWIALGAGATVAVEFWIDPLTAIMLVTVCGVATLVVVYSRDYMREHGEPVRGYERFFAYLGLFVFSMCVLVLAGNFLLLYLGWEAVGLCSYLLIGFHYDRPAAAAAAKKAFLVNRIGDFGFGLAILFIYLWISPHVAAGQSALAYSVVFDHVGDLTQGQCTIIALLLFCGAAGKSAQLPLYVWLPDAMEGPSPVSALIHAATMVTAGVYMVARCGPIFAESAVAMAVVAVIGAATALFAATIALAQYDMKRILAYSTISQLGYMFLGLGVGAAPAAIFHLFTHAFFKALLFLGAGSVMHAMGGVIDVRRFGGLRRVMPTTYRTFLIGGAALAGFPLLSGFFSKDAIIHHALAANPILGIVGLITAALTAVYTFRMIFLAFHGPEVVPDGVHAHESPKWMTTPLMILAVGAVLAGYVTFLPHANFDAFLAEPTHAFAAVAGHAEATAEATEEARAEELLMMLVSAAIALGGILVAWFLYVLRREETKRDESRMLAAAGLFRVLHNKYFVDEGYDRAVVRPLRQAGRGLFGIDRFVIDGLVWLVTAVPRGLAFLLQGLQRGAIQGYGLVMAIGIGLILILVLRGQAE